MADFDDIQFRGGRQWVSDSNEVTQIKLVSNGSDLKGKTFNPEYTHQIFEDEKILGYQNLSIKIYYAAGSLKMFVGIDYSKKYKGEEFPVTNIMEKLTPWVPQGFSQNLDEFQKIVDEDAKNFKPIGEQFHEYQLPDHPNKSYIMTKGTFATPGLRNFHQRIETIGIFTIETANFIDDDEKWQFFYLYEKSHGSQVSYSTIGYCTVFDFYAYPDNIRPRISQFVILPPYQKKGHGSHMYQAIFKELASDKKVVDVAVETPAPSFQELRIINDVKYLLESKLMKETPFELFQNIQKVKELQKQTKIPLKQLMLCLEILSLQYVKMNDKNEARKYRLKVKQRLFKENELESIEKAERYPQLDQLYEEVLDHHREILGVIA